MGANLFVDHSLGGSSTHYAEHEQGGGLIPHQPPPIHNYFSKCTCPDCWTIRKEYFLGTDEATRTTEVSASRTEAALRITNLVQWVHRRLLFGL